MSKSVNKIKKQLSLCNDLIIVFKEYATKLDNYFKEEENRVQHFELYNEYKKLNIDLKNVMCRNGFGKYER